MAAMGQPSLAQFQQGADGNFNPTIQDWVTAYKPVDKALNKVFETRITNANARQVQFNLAVVRLPPRSSRLRPYGFVMHRGLCMLSSWRRPERRGLGERRQQCRPALAGPGSGAWLHARPALTKETWLGASSANGSRSVLWCAEVFGPRLQMDIICVRAAGAPKPDGATSMLQTIPL